LAESSIRDSLATVTMVTKVHFLLRPWWVIGDISKCTASVPTTSVTTGIIRKMASVDK